MELGCNAAAELEELRWHWGGACDITEKTGTWTAVRRDNGGVLIAACAGALLAMILADYK